MQAAVIAIREVWRGFQSWYHSHNPDGRTLFYGTDPATATVVLQSLGADAIGINCSTGPEDMIEPIEKWQSMPQSQSLQSRMRVAGAGEWCDSLQDGTRGVCFLWKKTGGRPMRPLSEVVETTPHIRALKEAVKDMLRV